MTLAQRIALAWQTLTGRRDYSALAGDSSPGYAGAAVNRLTSSLATWSGSANADLEGSLAILRARARHLAQNTEHGRRFLSLVATNVVGSGTPKLQVRAINDFPDRKTGKPVLDKPANDAIEIHWERWGRTADITGRNKSLSAFLRVLVKGVARDGEALVRKVRGGQYPYGLALQMLEADRLHEGYNTVLDNGHVVRMGVEIDTALRPIALWLRASHPGDSYGGAGHFGLERVAIDDIYHLFLPERAEQVRGATWLHAVILRGSTIARYERAALVAAEVGASKIAALQRSDDAPDAVNMMADGSVGGIPNMKVEAGEMFELPPGYTLASWNPEYPHANFDSFLKACLRGLAAGLDVAAHNLTGDMAEVNYSSARIAELAERQTWIQLQDWLITSFLLPLFEEWLAGALLRGQITFAASGKALPAEKYAKFAAAARFQGRRWAWVDPAKEADAQEKLLANLLTSRTRIAAESGEEFDDILDELAQESGAIEAAGLDDAPAPAPAPMDSEQEDKAIAELRAEVRAFREQREAPAVPANVTIHNHPPVVNLTQGEVRTEISMATPTFAPEIRNEITIPEQPAPQVDVRVEAVMPEQAAPTVEVNVEMPDELRMAVTRLPDRRTRTDIKRNQAGDIVESTQLETDA